jgi:hypothetical protein
MPSMHHHDVHGAIIPTSTMHNVVGSTLSPTTPPQHVTGGQTRVYGHVASPGSPVYGTSPGQTSPLGQTTSESESESDEAGPNATLDEDTHTRPRRRGKLSRMRDGIKGMLGMKKGGIKKREHHYGDDRVSPEDVARHGDLPGSHAPGYGFVPGLHEPGKGVVPGSHGPGYGVGPGLHEPGKGAVPGLHGPGYGNATPDPYANKENYAGKDNYPGASTGYAGKEMRPGGGVGGGGPFMNVTR